MKKRLKRALVLLIAALMLAGTVPASASKTFSDVPNGAWYKQYIDKITQVDGILDGYGDGTFMPEKNVTRGEFLKMMLTAVMMGGSGLYTTDRSRDKIHWAGYYYTLALENNVLVADVYSGGVMFECTYAELEKPITRYEMAVILTNACTNIALEPTVTVTDAASYIPDYPSIPGEYVNAVEQSYGKGLLTGMQDSSFAGSGNLRRCEAAAVIYRYLWGCELAPFAKKNSVSNVEVDANFVPFAVQYQSMSETERRTALFGNPNKTYFASAAEAAAYMTTVTVPIWTMDKSGNKISSSTTVTVHRLVAKEIQLIFEEIYNDPERFPIYGGWSIGGSRYTDTMRHSWGCAIDINAFYNCECTVNWTSGTNRVTCGYGWWPSGTEKSVFAGTMTEPSPYSISAGSSVVRAFARYGWGWGGQGYSLKSNGNQKFDYMHFSILPSGG